MTIIDKIFKDKKGNTLIYILLITGIFLFMMGSIPSKPQKNQSEEKSLVQSEEKSLEERLEEILSRIKGVGEVSVMISEENSGTKVFGYDTDGKNKKTVILSAGGTETALVKEQKEPSIRGVIVVAEGGGNIKVKEALLRAVRAAAGIEPHKIEVFERNEVK